MRDRTLDLQNAPAAPPPEVDTGAKKKPAKKGKKGEDEVPVSTINEFFEELATTKEEIASINSDIEEIKEIYNRTLNNVVSEKQNAELARELDASMDKTNRKTANIRRKLKQMDQDIKILKGRDPDGNDTQIRATQHGVITKNFMEIMTEYKQTQESYQAKFKERMHRQALIVKPNATKEEIDKMIEGEYGQMFAKQIVNTAQRMEAKKALEDIQNKHLEVVKIEKSILELQQLFMDMAVMIASQGEVIDQIAVHVENAVDDTDKGVKALTKAVKIQRNTRKKMCWILFLIIGIVVAVILVTKFVGGVKIF